MSQAQRKVPSGYQFVAESEGNGLHALVEYHADSFMYRVRITDQADGEYLDTFHQSRTAADHRVATALAKPDYQPA